MLGWLQTREGLEGRCSVHTLPDILARGEKSPVPKMAVPGQDGMPQNPIFSLFYTSGSTGLPKGAIYTEEMWCASLAALSWLPFVLRCAAVPVIFCRHLRKHHAP